jgi:hypothetical protein
MSDQTSKAVADRVRNGGLLLTNQKGGVIFLLPGRVAGSWDIGVQPDTGKEQLMAIEDDEVVLLSKMLADAVTGGQR